MENLYKVLNDYKPMFLHELRKHCLAFETLDCLSNVSDSLNPRWLAYKSGDMITNQIIFESTQDKSIIMLVDINPKDMIYFEDNSYYKEISSFFRDIKKEYMLTEFSRIKYVGA